MYIHLDPIDCTANLCDLAWLIRDNRQLLNYVKSGTCSNGTAFTNLNPSGFPINCNVVTTPSPPIEGCPQSAAISPCKCSKSMNGININCKNQSLSDSQLSTILNVFLSPGISPVTQLDASYNKLTKIPSQIPNFTSLQFIQLNSNQITSIPSGTFNYPSTTYLMVDLSWNQIRDISSCAFNLPKIKTIQIYLYSNLIASIPYGTFNFPTATDVSILLFSNQITSLPSDPFNYPLATQVVVYLYSNQITSIPSGAFIYPSATYVGIALSNNNISTIPVDAFNFSSGTYTWISLNSNRITTIPAGSFKGILNVFNLKIQFSKNVFTNDHRQWLRAP